MAAENVTGWFTTEELGDDANTTEVIAALTVWTYAPTPEEGEALLVKLESPRL
jgi:hypothetical protein